MIKKGSIELYLKPLVVNTFQQGETQSINQMKTLSELPAEGNA